ncbi:MAG: hypothetical protein IAF94_10130 [Pirellulaceae bacterium]|nr:hypothetical protein [Pirellulaceae bacterium]
MSVQVSHVFAEALTYSVAAKVADSSILVSPLVTRAIGIHVYEVQTDWLNPGKNVLVVGASSTDDNVTLKIANNPDYVKVKINEKENDIKYRFRTDSDVSRIVVYGQAGDDKLTVEDGMAIPTWLYGGLGNDKLKGGDGADVLLGGDGDDALVGNEGRDLLIGGRGADKIKGSDGDDILVAGYTAHDASDVALLAIMDEWNSSRTYSQRVNNLRNGSGTASRQNGSVFLSDATTFDDGVEDVLTGENGFDWYLLNSDGGHGSKKDRITDASCSEFQDDIDFWNG